MNLPEEEVKLEPKDTFRAFVSEIDFDGELIIEFSTKIKDFTPDFTLEILGDLPFYNFTWEYKSIEDGKIIIQMDFSKIPDFGISENPEILLINLRNWQEI